MSQSVKVVTDNCKFKFRVSGLLVHNGKLLTTDMDDSGFLCLPGGYINLGEDSKAAVLREMEEEVKYKVEVDHCIAVVENFFVNKKGITMHEVAFYYLLNIANGNSEKVEDYQFIESDDGRPIKHDFKWIDLKNIYNVDFRPAVLKDKLYKADFEFEHIIYKEN